MEKKILENSINIKWYSIIESTESTKNILGPQTKFKENRSCVQNNNDNIIGAIVVVGLGIKKSSLVNILNKSDNICNAPLRPIKVGPILRCTKDRSLRSIKTTNKVSKITNNEDNNAISCKI